MNHKFFTFYFNGFSITIGLKKVLFAIIRARTNGLFSKLYKKKILTLFQYVLIYSNIFVVNSLKNSEFLKFPYDIKPPLVRERKSKVFHLVFVENGFPFF